MEIMEINEHGGKQSSIPYKISACPVEALTRVAETFTKGAQTYGFHNWELIPVEDSVDHAIYHLLQYLMGDEAEDHLVHAMARCAMAITNRGRGIQSKIGEKEEKSK